MNVFSFISCPLLSDSEGWVHIREMPGKTFSVPFMPCFCFTGFGVLSPWNAFKMAKGLVGARDRVADLYYLSAWCYCRLYMCSSNISNSSLSLVSLLRGEPGHWKSYNEPETPTLHCQDRPPDKRYVLPTGTIGSLLTN